MKMKQMKKEEEERDDDGRKEEIFSNFHIEKKIQLLKGKIYHTRFSVKNNEPKGGKCGCQ